MMYFNRSGFLSAITPEIGRRTVLGLCIVIFCANPLVVKARPIFQNEKFTGDDAVLVSDQSGNIVYQWQSEKLLIPASLNKLVTAYLAIDKWGVDHRFTTEFYLQNSALWVKGYGDPYLISEELDLLASALTDILAGIPSVELESIHIDANYFAREPVPARSGVNDPYNAPQSAVAANFNTVILRREAGKLVSAESQTPLTDVAVQVGTAANIIGEKSTRINLGDSDLAQQYFAELLLAKMGITAVKIEINQSLPRQARLIYRHRNSVKLADVLRGALKYSNNFVANQVFLMLGEKGGSGKMQFANSSEYAQRRLAEKLAWQPVHMLDGSGLSRRNNMTASQLNQVLQQLRPYKSLLKQYQLSAANARAFAKTGTLDGVHSFAGFLEIAGQSFNFVFIFNRRMHHRYREKLLEDLAQQLVDLYPCCPGDG